MIRGVRVLPGGGFWYKNCCRPAIIGYVSDVDCGLWQHHVPTWPGGYIQMYWHVSVCCRLTLMGIPKRMRPQPRQCIASRARTILTVSLSPSRPPSKAGANQLIAYGWSQILFNLALSWRTPFGTYFKRLFRNLPSSNPSRMSLETLDPAVLAGKWP